MMIDSDLFDERPEMQNDTMYVQMFNGFEMTYQGKSVMGGKKSNETQFAYLMQLLLHYRDTGVSRDYLEKVLFDDREIDNVHHAMQSVIYNAKKKLQRAGLPKVNYITFEQGIFYWTKEIPVIEDAREFERLYQLAEEITDKKQKIERYLQACYMVTGEFLSLQASVTWAGQESRRYRSLFSECVEKAVELLRSEGNYYYMDELGRYAAKIAPFCDWESVSMEALINQGRYDEAAKFYADTVDLYFTEQGLRPSPKMMESLEYLGSLMEHPHGVLDVIQAQLAEGERGRGGYMCSYPVFQGIYQMIERMMERGGQAVCLMMCTIVDSKGAVMKDGPILDEMSRRLGEAICCAVRYGDAVNRYGKGQFLVLLVNTTKENCSIIQKRIDHYFKTGRQRIGVQYYVNTVKSELREF